MLTQRRKVFSIQNIIQFDLEHRRDYMRRSEFDLGPVEARQTDLYTTEPCRRQEGDYKDDTVERIGGI